MKINSSKMSGIAITALSILLSAAGAYAAPGTLSDTPLFVSTAVDPNLFMIMDDSGSMWWGQVYQENVGDITTVEGLPQLNGMLRRYWHPQWMPEVVPPAGYQDPDTSATWDDALWLLRNHNANKLYYNPDVDYQPWPGKDSSGNALFEDADPEKAQRHPQWDNPETVDLTKSLDYVDVDKDGCDDDDADEDDNCILKDSYFIPSYYTWTDDGNGIIEVSDKHTLIEIKPGTSSYPSGRTYKKELQNFANWFQYHRKREFAAKAAIGSVIDNAEATRIGLYAFNAGLLKDVKSMEIVANKTELLKSLYAVESRKRTPARNALYRVGQQFQKTSSSAPILPASEGGECQQNFSILMSDGFYNQGVKASFGNADKSETADNGFDGDETESIDGGNYEDEHKETLADIAMYFYENDLRTDLGNKVPTKDGVDLADHQHLVLYTVSFGLKGSLDPTEDDPLDKGFEWPSPWTNEIHKVDDMWHAAYNGRGEYLSANNTEELKAALNEAVADITKRTATAAAASVTSARLTTSSRVFVSEFNTDHWQGTVYAYGIVETDAEDSSGNSTTVRSLTNAPLWDAATELEKRANPAETRVIMTYDRSSKKDGIPFQWDNLTTEMQNDLLTNASGAKDSTDIGKARLQYLRGDRSNEGAGLGFRKRAALLGDIVHSAPAYIAKSNLPWPDEKPFPDGSSAYSKFKSRTSKRKGVVYVGANDGMLHGFDEASGKELIAYIPSYLFSNNSGEGLHYLTDPDYGHHYYHDASPMITDALIGGNWRTILVSGQAGGGRGYFALDITSPEYFTEARASKIVLGEFSSNDDPDLGYTFSRPQVGMTNDGKFSIIFGNGYNDTGDGEAKLFILEIEGGADGTWSASDYREITTGVGSKTNRNGLSSPQLVDLDGDGTADRAYAGDLFGNMWAFDLRGSSKSSWKTAYGNKPLFTTIGNRPITTKPAISLHPGIRSNDDNYPNIMVSFGSGQYLVDADKSSTYSNYFYGVWDKGSSGLTYKDLMSQPYRTGFGDARVLARKAVDYSTEYGWFIGLPDSGERSITNPQIRSGIVLFNTNVPTTNPCLTGGYAYRFAVDLKNGGAPARPIVDTNEDGVVDDDDYLDEDQNVETATKFDKFLNRDTLTREYLLNERELVRLQIQKPRKTGRLSWQELLRND